MPHPLTMGLTRHLNFKRFIPSARCRPDGATEPPTSRPSCPGKVAKDFWGDLQWVVTMSALAFVGLPSLLMVMAGDGGQYETVPWSCGCNPCRN